MAAASPALKAKADYVQQHTAGVPVAANWGNSFLVSNVPGWAQEAYLENVLFTRLAMAQNPTYIDGSNLNVPANVSLNLPEVNALFANDPAAANANDTSATGGSVDDAIGATQFSSAKSHGVSITLALIAVAAAAIL
jgi:hypothetical protein